MRLLRGLCWFGQVCGRIPNGIRRICVQPGALTRSATKRYSRRIVNSKRETDARRLVRMMNARRRGGCILTGVGSLRTRAWVSFAARTTATVHGRVRGLVVIALALSVIACSGTPLQLAPRAIGCYAVELDSFPEVFTRLRVERPPALIRMDTLNGASLHVPRDWAEWDGRAMRRARLGLMRPEITLRNGNFVKDRRPVWLLPPDSVVLDFNGVGAQLEAVLEQDAAGDWFGTAYVFSTATPDGHPLVPISLKRRECGTADLIPYIPPSRLR